LEDVNNGKGKPKTSLYSKNLGAKPESVTIDIIECSPGKPHGKLFIDR